MDLNLARQIVIQKAQQYGVSPDEAMSLWQQEGSGTTDLSLQGKQLSRNRGRAIGPFQVVPYYHPNFPINGSFEEQADYAIKEWASGGSTLMDRVKNYYGSGKPPKGDPTPEQYAASIAKRMGKKIDTRMAGDSTNAGMNVPATIYPLSNDFGEELPADSTMMDQLLQQYMQKMSEPAAPQRPRAGLKDMMLNMGLSILSNPQGAMGSPVAGIAQGVQQGMAQTNQDYEQQVALDRQAQMDEQKKAHDMIWAAQVAQSAGGEASGGGDIPAAIQVARELARTRGRAEPNEQDYLDAAKIKTPDREQAIEAAKQTGKQETKAIITQIEQWPITANAYNAIVSATDDTIKNIDEMLQIMHDNPTATGTMAAIMQYLPETSAREWQDKQAMLRSNIALEKLSELKSLSPTGASGFGALSEGELRVIQDYMGRIDQLASPEAIAGVLTDMKRRLQAMSADATRGYQEDMEFVIRNKNMAPRLYREPQVMKQDQGPAYVAPSQSFRDNMRAVQSPGAPAPSAPAAQSGWRVIR